MGRALSRAVAYLAQELAARASGKRLGGQRVPPVLQLASAAGVSYVTMWKAVQQLRQQGLLTPHGRVRAVGADQKTPAGSARAQPAPSRVAAALEVDVLRGAYALDAALPTSKVLCGRYGTCFRTLRQALERLVDERVLVRHGRTHRPSASVTRRSGSTLVLVLRGASASSIFLYPVRTWEYLRVLESECSRLGIRLESVPMSFRGDAMDVQGVVRRIDTLLQQRPVLGFMLWTMGLGAFDSAGFVRRLLRHDLPVSVLDEVEHCPADLSSQLANLCHVRVAHSTHAGLEAGRHVLGLGHRTCTYITHQAEALYSAARLEGLKRAFRHAGLPESSVRVFSPADPKAEAADLPGEWLIASPPSSRPVAGVPSDVEADRLRVQRYGPVMGQAVRQALADRERTAWVCVSDDVAIYCLDSLQAAGVGVPDEVSVVGFDDTLDATRRRLTSYNFNNYGVVRACLDHLLRPRTGLPRPRRRGALEIDGYVVQRQSSGPVRREAAGAQPAGSA